MAMEIYRANVHGANLHDAENIPRVSQRMFANRTFVRGKIGNEGNTLVPQRNTLAATAKFIYQQALRYLETRRAAVTTVSLKKCRYILITITPLYRGLLINAPRGRFASHNRWIDATSLPVVLFYMCARIFTSEDREKNSRS